jgi:hypothetical protein
LAKQGARVRRSFSEGGEHRAKDKSIKIKVNALIVRELVPLRGIGGQKKIIWIGHQTKLSF